MGHNSEWTLEAFEIPGTTGRQTPRRYSTGSIFADHARVRMIYHQGVKTSFTIDASGFQSPSFYWNHGTCPIAQTVFMMAEAKPAEAALAKAAPAK